MIKKAVLHIIYIIIIGVYAFFIGCPVYRVFGVQCPFCGMTRAHVAFICGDFMTALNYNELFFLGVPICLCIAHLRLIKRRKFAFRAVLVFLITAFSALTVRYVIKLTI